MRRGASLAFASIVVVTACSDDGVPLSDSSTSNDADETGDSDTLPSTITISESGTSENPTGVPTDTDTGPADTSGSTDAPSESTSTDGPSESGTSTTEPPGESSTSSGDPSDDSSTSSVDPTSESSESTGGVPFCGDGIVQGDEVCDGDDLGDAETCADLGYMGGPLACEGNCLHDESACNDEPAYAIDFCRLQFPLTIDDAAGAMVGVFGRVYIGGLTDQSQGNDTAANVAMQTGYGGDGSDPELDASWVWFDASPNASYGPGSPGFEMNNDEYGGTMSLPVAGSYDFAVRFTGDGGGTWTVCDGGDAGSSDGYAPADAGQMTTD
jgi:hypothetical protein